MSTVVETATPNKNKSTPVQKKTATTRPPKTKTPPRLQVSNMVFDKFKELKIDHSLQTKETRPRVVDTLKITVPPLLEVGPGLLPNNTEQPIIKLFAGQIPKTMEVEEVIELFSECGKVTDASIIYNNMKQHQGCAFVFMEHTSAVKAIALFHNTKKLGKVSNGRLVFLLLVSLPLTTITCPSS